jgi:hypothetical protein
MIISYTMFFFIHQKSFLFIKKTLHRLQDIWQRNILYYLWAQQSIHWGIASLLINPKPITQISFDPHHLTSTEIYLFRPSKNYVEDHSNN